MSKTFVLDTEKLQIYLDAKRAALNLTWKDTGEAIGVSPSTLSRISSGRNPDADGLVAILAWLGIEISKVTAQVTVRVEVVDHAVDRNEAGA